MSTTVHRFGSNDPLVQVNAVDEDFAEGYQHLWLLSEIWCQLGITASWFQWHSRQLRSGTLAELERLWDLSPRHIIRPDSYKGEQQVTTVQGVQYDACTSPRLLLIFGVLARGHGLGLEMQKRCLGVLRRMLSLVSFPDGVAILPDLVLKVEEGQVKVKRFLKHFGLDVLAALRQRWAAGKNSVSP